RVWRSGFAVGSCLWVPSNVDARLPLRIGTERESVTVAFRLKRRLGYQLNQRFARARLLIGAQDEKAITAVGRWIEPGETVCFHGHVAGRRKIEVTTVRPYRVKCCREVPGRAFVRWRLVKVIGLGDDVMRRPAKVAFDARSRIRQSDADLKPAPDNGRGP